MYTQQDFLERFRELETEELVHRLGTYDLTEAAQAAIQTVFEERGLSDEQLEAHVKEIRRAILRHTSLGRDCDACGEFAGFFPVKDQGQKFCSKTCLRTTRLMEIALDFSAQEVLEHARFMKHSPCPNCRRQGSEIEVRKSYFIRSFLWTTRRTTSDEVCCRRCGIRSKARAIVYCATLGWWSFPWGIPLTIEQILANLIGMFQASTEAEPSKELLKAASLDLAANWFGSQSLPDLQDTGVQDTGVGHSSQRAVHSIPM